MCTQSYLNRTYQILMFYLPVSGEEQARFAQHSSLGRRRGTDPNTDRSRPSTEKGEKRLHDQSPSVNVSYGQVADVPAEKTSPTKLSDCQSAFYERRIDSEGDNHDGVTTQLRARMLASTALIPKDKLGSAEMKLTLLPWPRQA